MVKWNGFFSVAAAMLLTVSGVRAGDGWYASFDEARDAAADADLPLLIHFHASYCGPCRQMTQQVFSQQEVQQQLQTGIAAVEVDVSRRPDLAADYGASTVPRDVVVYPGESPETLNIGFKSTQAYLDLLRGISRKGAALAAARKPAPEQLVAQKAIIGLEGFCPVRLLRDREWISGQKDISDSYRGITYYFSSEEEHQEFVKNPRLYTPQNLGCDPIVLYEDQRAIAGKIKFGAFFDNQLFLFSSPDHRTEFKQNPLKYARIRHAVRVDELSGQRFN
ncbi:MAG: thioredoxin family protein [Fuerstiella sp.]